MMDINVIRIALIVTMKNVNIGMRNRGKVLRKMNLIRKVGNIENVLMKNQTENIDAMNVIKNVIPKVVQVVIRIVTVIRSVLKNVPLARLDLPVNKVLLVSKDLLEIKEILEVKVQLE